MMRISPLRILLQVMMFAAIVAAWFFWQSSRAAAQDVHHHAGMSPDVDKFYSTWRVPNRGADRVSSCCNHKDCAPAQIKLMDGRWYGRRDEDIAWQFIPDSLLESNQRDPRESPDERSHICIVSGRVICAVLGSGQ